MTCNDTSPLLSALLDRELAPPDARALEAHVAACPACREEIDSLRGLVRRLAAECPPDPSFLPRFRARWDRELRPDPARTAWRRMAIRILPLAAAALIAVGALVLSRSDEREPPLPPLELAELEAREIGVPATSPRPVEEEDEVLSIAFEPLEEAGR